MATYSPSVAIGVYFVLYFAAWKMVRGEICRLFIFLHDHSVSRTCLHKYKNHISPVNKLMDISYLRLLLISRLWLAWEYAYTWGISWWVQASRKHMCSGNSLPPTRRRPRELRRLAGSLERLRRPSSFPKMPSRRFSLSQSLSIRLPPKFPFFLPLHLPACQFVSLSICLFAWLSLTPHPLFSLSISSSLPPSPSHFVC